MVGVAEATAVGAEALYHGGLTAVTVADDSSPTNTCTITNQLSQTSEQSDQDVG